jgi:predicted HTH domain antitoxin
LEVRIEIAEKFIEKGQMSLEDIADCASLPLEKVRELADKLQPQMA